MTNTRAQWITGVPDLYADLPKAGEYMTVPQVSEATGYAPSTIKDLLSRTPIESDVNPLAPLSRPAARIGTNPLYSTDQVDQCQARRAAQGSDGPPLPKIEHTEATRRNLLTTVQIAELAGVHEQSVRKWSARSATFPNAVAEMRRPPGSPAGVPFKVFPRGAVIKWLKDNGHIQTTKAAAKV